MNADLSTVVVLLIGCITLLAALSALLLATTVVLLRRVLRDIDVVIAELRANDRVLMDKLTHIEKRLGA